MIAYYIKKLITRLTFMHINYSCKSIIQFWKFIAACISRRKSKFGPLKCTQKGLQSYTNFKSGNYSLNLIKPLLKLTQTSPKTSLLPRVWRRVRKVKKRGAMDEVRKTSASIGLWRHMTMHASRL